MKLRRAYFAMAVLAAAVLGQIGPAAGSSSCTEYTGSFVEDFSDVSDIDEVSSAAQFWFRDRTYPQHIMTLNRVGANFGLANPSYVPAWVNALAVSDFDLDGWPDYVGTSSSYSNVLAFVRNRGALGQVGTFQIAAWIDGSTGDTAGTPTRGVGGAAIDTEGHSGITSGDYDGDGDFDFLLVVSTTAGSYPIKRIWLYENTLISNGVNTGTVSFRKTDLTSAWTNLIKGIAWSSTMMVSLKFDADLDTDIVMGNKAGEILKITNTNNGRINAQTFVVEPTPLIVTGWSGRGVSTISVADFDGVPGLDILVGSVSTADLRLYKNDGNGKFTLAATFTDPTKNLSNDLYDGGATVSLSNDFDRDGDQDVIIGTDNWNYGGDGYGGKCYYFQNAGNGTFIQKLVFNGPAKTPKVYDFDLGAVLDFDNDGDMDFLIADGNDSKYYYLFVNVLADVYNKQGVGLSKNITPALAAGQYAITRVRLTGLDQRILGSVAAGLSIEYYVSNNDGRNWEFYIRYDGTGIVNAPSLPWHDFGTFGSRLRWKAVLGAAEDQMSGYTGASFETPVVDTIRMEYVYVEKREYSRSSVAATAVSIGGSRRKLLIASSFLFPGLEGQLRAYDVTGIPLATSGGSAMRLITTADPLRPEGRHVETGGSIFWDAGRLLRDRDQASRTIYAGYRAQGGATLQRLDFTPANADTLGPLLGDVDGNNAGLIRFVRGEGRDWKLGDILHSSPVVLGPPSGDPVALGAGYADFVQANADRRSVVFVGANDGMLHCFETETGLELWGFIPYNLLPKLKNLRRIDSRTGELYYASDFFVDGTPAVTDAYFGGRWRTVLMCGQGAGSGSSIGGGLNYYFALDVTNPADPQPLWELTETYMGESWSVPAFGQVQQGTTPYWVAFLGSGYDNNPTETAGNRIYIVRLDTGQILRSYTVSNVQTSLQSHPRPYYDIYVTIPGSPTAVDINRDGRTEYAYIGDLDGRLYRMDVTGTNANGWALAAVYTDRMNYPIITKPAVFPDPETGGLPLRIFFGTGGDDRAFGDRPYAFICLRDDGGTPAVEWYLGDLQELSLAPSLRAGSLEIGEKIWADPVIADNIVYFSTLKGSIENANPCQNLVDLGRFYGRFVRSIAGSLLGGTALKNAGGASLESLQLASKARKAVTVGEQQKAPGTYKREIYVQEYDSTVERLEQPVGSLLRVVSWREVRKIIR